MVHRILAFLLLALLSSAAMAADPFSMLLMHLFWDKAVVPSAQAGIEAMSRQREPPAAARRAYAKLTEEERLKALIDDNFGYLSAVQRGEIHGSLMRVLSDPEYAAMRAAIIDEFTARAMLVGQARRILDSLSSDEKRGVAAQAVTAYSRLPAGEQQEIIRELRAGIGYIPPDLNDMLLAEFSRVSR